MQKNRETIREKGQRLYECGAVTKVSEDEYLPIGINGGSTRGKEKKLQGSLEFVIALEDFDRSVLPENVRSVRDERFEQAVITYYQRQFAEIGGDVSLDMDDTQIHVIWTPDSALADPFEYALTLLERGEPDQALPLLESLHRAQPKNLSLLYNLGLLYSDLGRISEAIDLLSRATEDGSGEANTFVALGVAHQRAGNSSEALKALRTAISIEPDNSYARRNLGAVMSSLGAFGDAEFHLREAVRLSPSDQQAVYGLAATLENLGDDNVSEADDLYQKAIDLDQSSQVAEAARSATRNLAQQSFKEASAGAPRMDALMYCLDAMKKFDSMTEKEVQAVTLEVALLGRSGLDTNDSTPKYTLNSLPGTYTGLHLVSLMYVGFKEVNSGHDMGFDLRNEYDAAKSMFDNGKG